MTGLMFWRRPRLTPGGVRPYHADLRDLGGGGVQTPNRSPGQKAKARAKNKQARLSRRRNRR